MKNIEMKNVVEIQKLVDTYKKYKAIYDKTAELFNRDKEYSVSHNVFGVLDDQIEEVLDDIGQWLCDLYYDWAGLREKHMDDFENCDDYYEWEDEINERHEDIAGLCEYIIGVKDYSLSELCILPVDFMNEFIAEYGMFRIADDKDVWII